MKQPKTGLTLARQRKDAVRMAKATQALVLAKVVPGCEDGGVGTSMLAKLSQDGGSVPNAGFVSGGSS